jgi:hypothetical protein
VFSQKERILMKSPCTTASDELVNQPCPSQSRAPTSAMPLVFSGFPGLASSLIFSGSEWFHLTKRSVGFAPSARSSLASDARNFKGSRVGSFSLTGFMIGVHRYFSGASPAVTVVSRNPEVRQPCALKPISDLFFGVIVRCRRHQLIENIPEVFLEGIVGY